MTTQGNFLVFILPQRHDMVKDFEFTLPPVPKGNDKMSKLLSVDNLRRLIHRTAKVLLPLYIRFANQNYCILGMSARVS